MEAIKGIFELVKSNWNSEDKQKHLKRKFNELTAIKKDKNDKLEEEESRLGKKRKSEVANWLAEVERVEDEFKNLEAEMREAGWRSKLWGGRVQSLSEEVCELIGKSSFEGRLVLDACESKPELLLMTKLVGGACQDNLQKICALLMKDEVSSIGIYGMGGVGKTTLVKHVYNLFLKGQNQNIYWITVSQDFSVRKLQDGIANAIKFKLQSEDPEIIRAANLSTALDKKHKSVLILDDLWNEFSREEVGIPIGCKLIMTTRSLTICHKMICDEKMKLEPLSKEESWDLFVEKLGNYATLSLKVKEIAKSVVQECNGLPLGIVTLAGCMRGLDDVTDWSSILTQLQQSITGPNEMYDKVFKVLNLSYQQLRDPVLQECFLYCALYPEDHKIERKKLIEYLISEDIIEDLDSREAQFDRGHTILNKLEKACLLEGLSNLNPYYDPMHKRQYVKMHDLIRDMAINKMKRNSKAMVEAGKRLMEVPNVGKWLKDLVRVSLMANDIKEIPGGHSPSCPNLSTLLLCRNYNLKFMADSFFLQFCELKVLDLSETAITALPYSISDLVSLTSLLLRSCKQLKNIPSLARVKKLKKLYLYGCTSVEVVPGGLQLLSDLQYLDMFGTSIKDIPNGLLPNLSHLQYLSLDWSTAVEIKSGCLGKVEYLACCFPKPHDFHSMMMDYHGRPLLSNFRIVIGDIWYCLAGDDKSVTYSRCDIGIDGDFVEIRKDLHLLGIFGCHTLRSLDNVIVANGPKSVQIFKCDGLEYLISPPFRPGGVFSCLKEFSIKYCPSITCLFPYELLLNLQNLEKITVMGCQKIEQIIGEESNSGSHTELINLPMLKSMEFNVLPELKTICSKRITCDSMETIVIWNCPKLKRMPLCLTQLDNGQLSRLPSLQEIRVSREWWNLVELDHPNAKDVLQPQFG